MPCHNQKMYHCITFMLRHLVLGVRTTAVGLPTCVLRWGDLSTTTTPHHTMSCLMIALTTINISHATTTNRRSAPTHNTPRPPKSWSCMSGNQKRLESYLGKWKGMRVAESESLMRKIVRVDANVKSLRCVSSERDGSNTTINLWSSAPQCHIWTVVTLTDY